MPTHTVWANIKMTSMVREAEAAGVPWWLVLIEGISLVILGLLMFSAPGETTFLLVQFIGIYWLVAGIFKIVSIFLNTVDWGWKLAGGILGILAGLIVLNHPLWSPFLVGGTLILLMGIQGLVFGGIGIYQAFKGAGWGMGIMSAVSVLFGLLLLGNVAGFTLALPWTIGILALIGGIVAIVGAFKIK